MNSRNLVFHLVIMFLLMSCISPVAPAKPVSSTVIVGVTLSPESEPTAALPRDVVTPTLHSTSTPLSIRTSTPASITQFCGRIIQKQTGENIPQGTLVLEQFFWEGAVAANYTITGLLYDWDTKQLISLDSFGRITQIIGVSPDRHYLLYEYDSGATDEYRLAVVDDKGKIIKDFDNRYNQDRWDYYNWQSNETIRVVKTSQNKVFPRVFSPFTENYTILSTEWIDIYKGEDLDWGLDYRAVESLYYDGANIVYDPTITRVVYPKKGEIASLVDVKTEQELASIQLPQWGRLPRWSDDGQNLVIIASTDPKATQGRDEFFIVSRDGPAFKRLTYLSNQFETVHISDYTWSPDGKQIAFWLNTEASDPTSEGTQSELAIVNIETGEITRLCIQGISALMTHEIQMTQTQPVWSPDGRQIAFAQLDPARAKSFNVIAVDLETKTAFKVTSNKEPIGWMKKEP